MDKYNKLINNLEEYIDSIDLIDKKLSNKIFSCWEYFNYPDQEIFKSDIEFIIQTVYPNLKITQDSKVRMEQGEFRKNLIKHYNAKCVITMNDSLDELEAAHIVEVKFGGNYDISNGLLLEANLHKTFDKYSWAINPDTMEIEANPLNLTKTISKYVGKKLNLSLNPFLYTNLKKRYELFKNKLEC